MRLRERDANASTRLNPPTICAAAMHSSTVSRTAAFHVGGGLSPGRSVSRFSLSPRKAPHWCMMARVRKKRLGPRDISDAIARSARTGDMVGLDAAMRAAREGNVALNAVNYTAIAVGLARGGEFRRCFEALASMRAANLVPTNATLRVATTACVSWAARGSVQRTSATLALQEMITWFVDDGEPRVEVKSWNMLLSAFGKLGARRRMLEVLRNMEVHGGKAYNVPEPDIYSYNTCLLAMKCEGLKALVLFARILRRQRVRPDVVTYNTLLKMAIDDERFVMRFGGLEGFSRDRFVNGSICYAKAVMRSMQRQNVDPDLRTWTCLFRLVGRQAESIEVKDLARFTVAEFWSMLRNSRGPLFPDLILCNAAIAAFAQVGDTRSAAEVLLNMQTKGVSADMYTMNSILAVLGRKGEVDRVVQVLDDLRSISAKLDTYSYVAALSACARCTPTRPDIAEELLEDARRDGVWWMPAMVNAAISSFGDRVPDAIRFWQRMQGMPQEHCRNAVKDVQTYEALFRVCGRAGRPDYALKIFYAMKKSSEFKGSSGTNLFHSFERGVREGKQEQRIKGMLARNYLEHFRTECRAFVLDLPVERIELNIRPIDRCPFSLGGATCSSCRRMIP